MSIFKQFVLSFYKFDAYPGFLKGRGFKIFRYSLLLITLTYLVTFVYIFAQPTRFVLGLNESAINEIVPYFEISNGQFFIEEPVIFDEAEAGTLIYITSDEVFPLETAFSVLEDYTSGIIIDSEKVVTGGIIQRTEVIEFSNFQSGFVSRDILLELLPTFKTVFVLMYVPVFLAYIGAYMFGTLLCSLIGMLVNVFVKAPVTFGGIFKLTAYARTVPIVLKMLLFLLPFNIPMSFVAFYAIYILYMVWALLAVKKTETVSEVNSN